MSLAGGFSGTGISYHLQYLTLQFDMFLRANLGALRADIEAPNLSDSEIRAFLTLAILEHRLGHETRALALLTEVDELLRASSEDELRYHRDEALQAIILTRAALLKQSDPQEARRLFNSLNQERSILRHAIDDKYPIDLVIQTFELARNRSGLEHLAEHYEKLGGAVIRGNVYAGRFDGGSGYFNALLHYQDLAAYAQDEAWLEELEPPLRRWETALSDPRRVPLMLLVDSFR